MASFVEAESSPKIKVFLWRLAQSSLPSADVLNHRNMATHDKCGICGAQDSWKHSLIECNLAKCVWALESEEVVEHLCCIQDTDAYAWVMAAMESLPGTVGDLVRAEESDTRELFSEPVINAPLH